MEKRNMCRLLVGKPEGRRPLGRPRCRRMNKIEMYVGDIGCGGVQWTGLAQDWDKWRDLLNVVMNIL
jgi:hypothetical protein